MFRFPFSICCPFSGGAAGADYLALSRANAASQCWRRAAESRGGFGMKRNANEKYSGRQGDAVDDARAAEGIAREVGSSAEKCRFGSWSPSVSLLQICSRSSFFPTID